MCFVEQALLVGAVEVDVFRFAVYDCIRRERCCHFGELLLRRSKRLDQLVVTDFEGLQSRFAEHHPDSRNHLLCAVAYGKCLFGKSYAGSFFDRTEHPFVDCFNFGGRIGSDEDSVVLKQQDRGLFPEGCFVGVDAVQNLFEQHISRIGVGNIHGVVTEQLGRFRLCVLCAHQTVDHGRVQVDDEACAQCVVHRGLHRRTAVFGQTGSGQIILYLLFAGGGVTAISFFRNDVQFFAVQNGKSVLCDRGQSASAGFDPQFFRIFIGSVSTPGDHIAAVLAVFL